jgi:hypothetical protein
MEMRVYMRMKRKEDRPTGNGALVVVADRRVEDPEDERGPQEL